MDITLATISKCCNDCWKTKASIFHKRWSHWLCWITNRGIILRNSTRGKKRKEKRQTSNKKTSLRNSSCFTTQIEQFSSFSSYSSCVISHSYGHSLSAVFSNRLWMIIWAACPSSYWLQLFLIPLRIWTKRLMTIRLFTIPEKCLSKNIFVGASSKTLFASWEPSSTSSLFLRASDRLSWC